MISVAKVIADSWTIQARGAKQGKKPFQACHQQGLVTATASNPLEDQRAVGAAKAKVVLDGDVDRYVPRRIGTKIQIALGILVEDIDRRRYLLVVQRQYGEHAFNSTGTTEQMACHGLGGADHGLVGMIAQGRLDGVGFALS